TASLRLMTRLRMSSSIWACPGPGFQGQQSDFHRRLAAFALVPKRTRAAVQGDGGSNSMLTWEAGHALHPRLRPTRRPRAYHERGSGKKCLTRAGCAAILREHP